MSTVEMENDEFIVSGPKLSEEVFDGTVAECLVPLMKSHDPDLVAQIDASTGDSIKARDFLRGTLEVAEGLVKFGLSKGDVVVLACPNSIRCQTAALGIMFSGGVLAPIDQNQKPAEIQYLLNIFQPKYLICQVSKAKDMEQSVRKLGLKTTIILLDSNEPKSEFSVWADITTPVTDVDGYVPRKTDDPKRDIVLISCSSGSTGYPKGVALSHRSFLFNYCLWKNFDMLALGRSLLLSSPLFWISGSVLTLLSTAFGQTRIIPKSCAPEDLLEAIKEYKAELTMLSPASIVFLVEHPNFNKDDVKSLKLLFTGGSLLTTAIINKVKDAWKDVSLLQGYGMTEFAGGVTSADLTIDPLSVGRILPDTHLKVVDPTTGKSLGPNEVGEARFKADRVMVGYYNNKEATEAAFDDKRWYKTGDLVYYNEDKLLYVVGRIKEIVKCRNYQISLSEIESFLMSVKGIADVAIVPVPHGLDYHMKAVVVKHPGSNLTENYIIQTVEKNMSDYKHLKAGVVFVESLPRSEVGKLKRWILQQLYETN